MLRVAAPAFLLLLALALPGAQAAATTDYEVSFGVGPDGLAAPGAPYFLRFTLTDPEAPRAASADDDCASTRAPAQRSLVEVAARLVAWKPLERPSFSDWFPTCTGGSVLVPCTPTPAGLGCGAATEVAYATYDVASGRYYVEGPVPAPELAASLALTGTTGAGSEADCEYCPPPAQLG